MARFLPQPEGLPLVWRPAALEITYVGPPHCAIPALQAAKPVAAGLTQLVLTGPSSWMYTQTGDWVAALFALGSLAYGLFFLSSLASRVGRKENSK